MTITADSFERVNRRVVETRPAPAGAANARPPEISFPILAGYTVAEVERGLVLQTLTRCAGNRTRAARILGISLRTLRNKIRRYRMEGFAIAEPPRCAERA